MTKLKYITILPALVIAGGLTSCKKAEDPNKKLLEGVKEIVKNSENNVINAAEENKDPADKTTEAKENPADKTTEDKENPADKTTEGNSTTQTNTAGDGVKNS
ncbi:hypothetical protein HUT03_03150 [Candidatus Liberibacter africanus]|uniref:hypothetical protein n=1 Tax=Liberibacter africanus TaxID=34020 RepID=UPI001AE4E392|nr:hypothetical protein [Candidatus Liberibacter africanus]QTP64022.1 hypothetical protein HUT03_03150 [Candidatus Liberibacter africanus]